LSEMRSRGTRRSDSAQQRSSSVTFGILRSVDAALAGVDAVFYIAPAFLPDEAEVGKRFVEAVSIGKMALANPDLVARIRAGAPLNKPEPSTFYGGDTRGETDYPALGAAAHPHAQPPASTA
jgi:2,4-dienoyl-CoA reductase-like NADH-dependent reductase (Old Yellow Enzyme family)